ncbi:MAG: thiol peroxidase [Firmicutes bacterium]|jgi:thiol peroxidase|nr:thiol peroxidase [Bacillota bacterium]
MTETNASRFVAFNGSPMALEGAVVNVNDPAPQFALINTDLNLVSSADFLGRVVLLATVPSLDTAVCDLETKKFDHEISTLGNQVAYLTVSMDLPFAQQRWCGSSHVHRVVTLSDYKDHQFGKDYGVYIWELGLLARAVFVIDPTGMLRYREMVSEVTNEPDYVRALSVVNELLKG